MNEEIKFPQEGDLRVWHIPQVPGEPFYIPVSTPEDAFRILNILGDYDDFQFRERIKPDYCNVSGLEVFESGEWCEWYDEDGQDIEEHFSIFEEE